LTKSNKTIAIVINTSWNVYNFRLNLLKSLQKDGYHIVVIAPHDNYTKLLIKEGFEFHHLNLDNDSTNTTKELKLFFHLLSLYRKTDPDVILHYTIKPNIYGNMAAAFLGKSTINNISGLGTVFLNDKLSSKIARMLYKLTLKFSGKVFFQNKRDKQLFIDNHIVKHDIVDLIPGSGIDTDYFTPIPFEPEKITFLFIGRLIRDKGIEEYIEAIKIVKKTYKDVRFQIIGSIYEKNPTSITQVTLNRWIYQGLVEYENHTDNIKEYISKASVVVLPSYREGLSRSLLEASSMAKPMVTTDVAGCSDIVDDGFNGFLCKAKDASSLADAMMKMIKLSDEQRAILGNNAREKALKNFSQDIIIRKYKETIKELIKNPKRYSLWGIKRYKT
jgi:glycosyltransferase involved in cell wall biosynthesis